MILGFTKSSSWESSSEDHSKYGEHMESVGGEQGRCQSQLGAQLVRFLTLKIHSNNMLDAITSVIDETSHLQLNIERSGRPRVKIRA
jgi:hypothetical protein